MADPAYHGAIELGGTKIVLAIGQADGRLIRRTAIPTAHPEQVMPEILGFFQGSGHALVRLGVGAFGPIVIDPTATDYGRLLETNKPGWSGFDLIGALERGLRLPVSLVTDVGAAAIGEARLGALRDALLGVYLTVGTGIGGAIVHGGRVLSALLHPEMGHIALQRAGDDHAPSQCLFHPACAEGLAAGPAITARFGQTLSDLASGGPEHLLIADYLGQLCANLVLTLSPHRIVLGGGVGQTPGLLPLIAQGMLRHLGGYSADPIRQADYLRSPELGQDAGIIGALLCAAENVGGEPLMKVA